jgi:hypothetical protein
MPVAEIKSYQEGKGTSTPWGRAQYSQTLERGVTFYGTAGHGGLSITFAWAEKNLTPHAIMLGSVYGGKLWYEEDCQINIVFYEYPDLFPRMMGKRLDPSKFGESVRTYNPEYFDADYQAACFLSFPMPEPKDLEQGCEVDLISYGSPGNVRTYIYQQPYGEKGKHFLVRGDDGALYRITQASFMNAACQIRQGGEVTWDRPQMQKYT